MRANKATSKLAIKLPRRRSLRSSPRVQRQQHRRQHRRPSPRANRSEPKLDSSITTTRVRPGRSPRRRSVRTAEPNSFRDSKATLRDATTADRSRSATATAICATTAATALAVADRIRLSIDSRAPSAYAVRAPGAREFLPRA